MKENRLIPKLRFPEFTDEWEQRKLGDVSDLLTGYPFDSKKFSKSGITLIRGMNVKRGYLDYSEEAVKYWNTSDGLEKYLLQANDVLIQMDGALIGKSYAKICKNQLPALLVQRVTRLRTDNIVANSDFLYQAIQKGFLEYIKGIKTETAVPHLSLNDIREFVVGVPDIEEQKKIGELFKTLDNTIVLHQRKVELLGKQKKGAMQKIFSQEVRFKMDDGSDYPEWEEVRLDEICSNFIVPMRDKPKKFEGTIPWCRIEDIQGKYFNTSLSGQFVSEEIVNDMNLKIHPAGTVICSCSASLGTYAIATQPLITNQTFIGLVCTDKVLNEFLYYMMCMQTRKLKLLSGGTTIPYISRNKFESFEINLPSYEEQQKIADFLSDFDTAINLAKQELEKWKLLKKGLLQQMFV